MSKYKISVYAITKNEEKNVDKWIDSMKEADEIVVLDTGSSDATVERLKKYPKVKVYEEIIKPWRFDIARNLSLSYVSKDTDICICTDLDERFEPGWRKNLEKHWQNGATRGRYLYNWSFDEFGKPGTTFYLNKIHTRNDYKWTHPVHEVLTCITTEREIFIPNITLNHYQDYTKARSSYLPLLELSVKEDPDDDRNMHYLGREYMYYKKWNEAIDTLIKHLNLKRATWKDERAASMRFIARSYIALERFEEARMWLDKAIEEAPYLRDAYIERALLENRFQNWKLIEEYCWKALEIKTHQKSYINEPFSWNHTVYDLLSLSYYYQGNYEKALECINQAIELCPNDERLLNNKKLIEAQI